MGKIKVWGGLFGVIALSACSSSEAPSSGMAGSTSAAGSVASAGSAGATGGSSAVAGAAGSGLAASGGASASGGHSSAGGNSSAGSGASASGAAGAAVMVEPGAPCDSVCPDGKVEACYGINCPLGQCDHGSCANKYSAPASASTVYCAAGQNGGYCMLTSTTDLSYWVINCVDGTPAIVYCPNSCTVSGDGVAGC